MIEIVKDIIVVSTNQILGAVANISGGSYAVVVDEQETPVALATKEDFASLNAPGSKALIQVVSDLPPALVAGRRIAIEQLITAATANPNLVSRGTVLMSRKGIAGVYPVGDMISHMRGLGVHYAATAAGLHAAIATSGRNRELQGDSPPGSIPIVCAR